MKYVSEMIFAGVIVMAFILSSGGVFAEQQPKSNSKRPIAKPSVRKTWGDEMRSVFQEQIHRYHYIRGKGAPEYDRP